MQNRHISIRLLAALLFAALLLGCAKSGGTSAEIFDFTELSGGLPLGWSVTSYENQYDASCKNGTVTLSSDIADDCRLLHTVAVSGGKKYVLSAEISTEAVTGGEGATLSIDNYGIDGSYLYSDGLYGTNGWQTVELAFETDRSQSAVQIALRLGGYSSVSSGTARFRNVSIEQRDNAGVPFQKLVVRSTAAETEKSKSGEEYEAFFTLLFWVTVLCAAVLLFGIYRDWERLATLPMTRKKQRLLFALIVGIGFVIRLVLCKAFKGHATDMGCWVAWGNQIADGGFATFYDGTWYDYPPGYMLILGALTWIMRLLQVSAWGSETLRLFWYMLPAFAADVLCGVLIVRFAREQGLPDAAGLVLGGLIVLNPAAVYLSGAWGQIDSILTLFLLLTYGQFRKGRRIAAGLLYAAAVLIKWQALIYGPVLAMVYLGTLFAERKAQDMGKALLKTALAAVAALAVIFVISLPFRGSMGVLWIVKRFLSASSGYQYATVEGYNFFALLGANWHKASNDLFEGAGAGRALLKALEAFGKLVVPTGTVLLGIGLYRDLKAKQTSLAVLSASASAGLCALLAVFLYAVPEAENLKWILYGAAVLLGVISLYAQWSERMGGWKALLRDDETAFYGVATGALTAAVTLGTWLVWMLLRVVGVKLTYQLLGTLQIALAAAGSVWLLVRSGQNGRLKTDDPELLYTLSAFFMLWVFTFGHYMHERYVFPVLFLLLFAYAANRDRKFLLCALLLTVSTLFNELIAMYVVSEGAIDAIRGGTTHNRLLAVCSALEVSSALYFTAVCFTKAFRERKGGNAE